ncbi:MAG: sulfatase [Planctomycetota bacterium]|jgi:arylsulfatase A-like enzyme
MLRPRAAAHPQPLLAALVTLCAACGGDAAVERPNVVLISIDTLRPDHLGCYGYRRPTSPNIDALAAEGALFEQHISSAPWTLPAHAAMFTSVPDSVHGVVDAVRFRLSEDFETLPESFQAAGYRTAGFFAGPYLHPAFGLGQGFDRYVDCVQTVADDEVDEDNAWSMRDPVLRASHHGVTNDKVYAQWQRFFGEASGGEEPFFAFVHLWDVHFDFTPPPPYDTLFDPDYDGPFTGRDFFYDPAINAAIPERDREHIVALYDGEIAWTDEIVGRIRHDLGAAGLLEDTVVVITADHGTELFDHGGKGHRTTLYDEQIRIPLIVHQPGVVRPGRFAGQTRMIDLGPTLRDLAGLPAVSTTMGESLAPYLRGERGGSPDRPAVSELMSVGRNLRSLRTTAGKYVVNHDNGGSAWFDLSEDPLELQPRLSADAEGGASLRRLYDAAAQEIIEGLERAPSGASEADVPDSIRRSLAANGYAGGDEDG